jgi:putative membrane protein (TIGR04086 family)
MAAIVAVPAGIAQNLAGRGSALTFPLFLAILLGLGFGGYVAGREAPDRRLIHGALAALAVYVVVQGVGIVLRLARGDTVSWIGIPFIALLALSCGVVGGYLAFRRTLGASS